jgi:hypothetical protein
MAIVEVCAAHPAATPPRRLQARFDTFRRNRRIPRPAQHDATRGTRARTTGDDPMPKYVIERQIPGAGKLSASDLKAISQKSCNVLRVMGPEIQWVHSYVTDDKIYCVYVAPDEATVREHATQGGFPVNSIARVHSVIEPVTSED